MPRYMSGVVLVERRRQDILNCRHRYRLWFGGWLRRKTHELVSCATYGSLTKSRGASEVVRVCIRMLEVLIEGFWADNPKHTGILVFGFEQFLFAWDRDVPMQDLKYFEGNLIMFVLIGYFGYSGKNWISLRCAVKQVSLFRMPIFD